MIIAQEFERVKDMRSDAIRLEIACAAARMIAEEGMDYASAKKKSIKQILGVQATVARSWVPDNQEIEEQVREYQAIFMSDTQPLRLKELRQKALILLTWLEEFQPYLVGPVWTGTAGEHSDIYIQCFVESEKDVEIFLLNEKIDYEVGERPDFRGRGVVEALYFMWQDEGVVLSLYPFDAIRGGVRRQSDGRSERADKKTLQVFLEKSAV